MRFIYFSRILIFTNFFSKVAIKKFENSQIKRKTFETLENFTVGKILGILVSFMNFFKFYNEKKGQGSYAQVKYAVDRDSNIKYAIKSYEKYKLVDAQKKKNVEREIFILEKLKHPNIISLHKVIRTPNTVKNKDKK